MDKKDEIAKWQARMFHELLSRDREDGCATGQQQGVGPEAYLNGTSQGTTSKEVRKDGHIRGHSQLIHEISGLRLLRPSGDMPVNKAILVTMACLHLTIATAWGKNAREFYERGNESSLAHKRIYYFSKAIELNPELAKAYEKRAIHYYFQNQFDKAIWDYTMAIELEPEETNGYMMRGLAYLKKGHGQGLFAELERLTRRLQKVATPKHAECVEKAIMDFSRVIELNPQLASAYTYRAEAYRVRGMIDEAIRDSTTAIDLRKDQQSTAKAYAIRAEVYRRLGKYEQYEADLREAVALDPYSSDYPPLHVPLMLRYPVDSINLKGVRWIGLVAIIILAFLVVFRITLKEPHKTD